MAMTRRRMSLVHRFAWWVPLLGVLCIGCGSGDDVSGNWCANAVKTVEACDTLFLELAQDGSDLSGQFCEQYNKNCNPLTKGHVDGSLVTFTYNFGAKDHADADLGWNLEDTELEGTLLSTACNCKIPLLLYRVK